jgi:hypothetical protein
MDPSRLDEQALRYELKIRDIEFVSVINARRELRVRLREEKLDPTKRPAVQIEDSNDEITTMHAYFNDLLEYTQLSTFERSELAGMVYSRLCHLERRFTQAAWDTLNDVTKPLYENLDLKLKEMRGKFYREKPLYVIETVNAIAEQNAVSFTEEEQKAMDDKKAEFDKIRAEFEALRAKKARATLHEISYAHVDDLEDVMSEEEEIEQGNQNDDNVRVILSQPQVVNVQQASQVNGNRTVQSMSDDHPFANVQSNSTMARPMPAFSSRGNCLAIHKWQYSYDGKCDGTVISFLKDVESMAEAQATSESDLRRGISTLLKDKALDWYRANGNACATWEKFKSEIKAEFLPTGFDRKVEDEIRSTVQDDCETFQQFCVRMELMFMKLSYNLSDERKLDHLTNNMRREYKTTETVKIKTLKDLREACRYLDSINGRYDATSTSKSRNTASAKAPLRVFAVESESEAPASVSEPSASAPTATGDLAKEIAALQALSRQLRSQGPSQGAARQRCCHNCNATTHVFRDCPQPRKKFCRFCGHKEVLATDPHGCRNRNNPHAGTQNAASGPGNH